MPRPVSLSFELLETFIKLVENGGDAKQTAKDLNIQQPSMSKRLRYLQLSSPVLKHPWLERRGKSWKLTEEGEKALPAVRDLVHRYDHLVEFADEQGRVDISFACGRQAAVEIVRDALREFREQYPTARVRLSTIRGAARIEGVANGSLDLACVTHSDARIREIARRELHVDPILHDRMALVCARKSPWAKKLEKLSKSRVPLSALGQFPLILPEPDAGLRNILEEILRTKQPTVRLDVCLEVGGWRSILAYVKDGMGVGVVSESVVKDMPGLIIRFFDPVAIPPTDLKLICRKRFDDSDELDLSPMALSFYGAVKKAAGRH